VRRASASFVVAGCVAAGCGGSSVRDLEAVTLSPPAGAQAAGQTGTRRSTADPPSGLPRFRLEPRAGDTVSYGLTVRSVVGEPVTVTGSRGQPDDEGVLVAERVLGAPVVVAPRGQATLRISGRIAGCAYDGQLVAVRPPRLRLRTADGEAEQQVVLPGRIELTAPRRGQCGSG